MRVLIAGCGYVGTALGLELAAHGHHTFGLRRDPAALPTTITPVPGDLTDPASLGELPPALDAVVFAASPDARDAASYRRTYVEGPRALLGRLAERGDELQRVLFASSTAVYGQTEGEWVNEDSPTRPASRTGRILVEAETAVANGSPWQAVVVRFGGIYGPGRDRLVRQVGRGEATCPEEPIFTNRIHRDDCAGALSHLLRLTRPDPVYCAVDHEPADRCEVLRWIADRIGAPRPPVGGSGRSRGGSKRVRNDRLVASGYGFSYPTFREGYAQLIPS